MPILILSLRNRVFQNAIKHPLATAECKGAEYSPPVLRARQNMFRYPTPISGSLDLASISGTCSATVFGTHRLFRGLIEYFRYSTPISSTLRLFRVLGRVLEYPKQAPNTQHKHRELNKLAVNTTQVPRKWHRRWEHDTDSKNTTQELRPRQSRWEHDTVSETLYTIRHNRRESNTAACKAAPGSRREVNRLAATHSPKLTG